MTDYDAWKTDPDHDNMGNRIRETMREEELFQEYRELLDKESDLEYELDEVREDIARVRRELGLDF